MVIRMRETLPKAIADIVLTDQGKKDQKEVYFITDLQIASEFEQEPKLTISRILGRGIPDFTVEKSLDKESGARTITETPVTRSALSVSEIVKLSKEHKDLPTLTRNQVNHHLRRMEELGFIHKFGTVWVGKRAIDYYRRNHRSVVITMETPSFGADFLLDREGKRLENALEVFNIQLSVRNKKRVAKLLAKNELLKDAWRGKIAGLVREDVADPQVVDMYHWLLDAYAMGDDEYIKIWREIRGILFGSKLEE